MNKNPFKVGDVVNIYCTHGSIYKNEIVRDVSGDSVFVKSTGTAFHYKQCRRVIKPREWWVNTKDLIFSDLFEVTDGFYCRTTKPDNTDGWILLREVKK